MKLLKNPSSTIFEIAKNTRCLSITSVATPTLLILRMCGITIRWRTRSRKFWPGYPHLNPRDGTRIFEVVGSTRWETGSYKLKNIGIGLVEFVGVNLVVQPYSVMEAPGLVRPTLGKRRYSRNKKILLISCGASSLVIDTLCKQAVGESAAVACFYFDFAAQEEQSAAAILGSVLRQVVGGLDKVPERIVKAFRDREKVIGGQRLELSEIVEFLQDISSDVPL